MADNTQCFRLPTYDLSTGVECVYRDRLL